MATYCIHSSVLGTEKHFFRSEDGFQWVSRVPSKTWTVFGEAKQNANSLSLDALFELKGLHLPQIPQKYLEAMQLLVTGSNVTVPWQHVMPKAVFENYFKNTVKVIEDSFSELSFDYYVKAWQHGTELLTSLKPTKIDVELWHQSIDTAGVNAPVLSSFKPDSKGFAKLPTYNRFGTRTGRLTISDGPNILVLKKDLRKILKSAFDGGVVCSLDFRALEPRVVLAEAGRSSGAEDMYGEVAEQIFGDRQNRDAVKVAIISELYGASKESLRARLGISQVKIDSFIKGINEYFELTPLRARLEEQAVSGVIHNRFGRPLSVDPEAKNLFINTYAQSTGVDVALVGFNTVMRQLGTEGVRPLFVLHDALILDVHPDRLKDVEAVTSVKVADYNADFPLKYEAM